MSAFDPARPEHEIASPAQTCSAKRSVPPPYRGTHLGRIMMLALVVIACVGCSSSGAQLGTPNDPPQRFVTLHVHNDQFADVRVYILRGSARIPLGAVRGFERRMFSVNTALLPAQGDVQFLARALAGEPDATSSPTTVTPGQTVEWRISFTPTLSSLIVR